MGHGINIQESPTPLTPPVQADSALPVAFGAAPVHRLEDPGAAVNTTLMIYNYGEGVTLAGYSDNWKDFGLSEMLYSQLRVHNISPLVLVNVWDPLKGAEDVVVVGHPVKNGVAAIDDGMAIISTAKVMKPDSEGAYERGKDYTLAYDGDRLLVTVVRGGGIPAGVETLDITYKTTKLSITAKDITGGIDAETGKRTGIELADEVFMLYGKVPGFLLAPGWSVEPEVASALTAKARSFNSNNFSCAALLDAPADESLKSYAAVPEWKKKNGISDPYAFVDWPCVAIGGKVFHASTRLAGLFGQTDASKGGRPYVSASNKALSMTKTCLEDGTEVPLLDIGQANLLNENGIGTFINHGGWRAWGNKTAAYPASTDVKDSERPIRRMFNWIQNTVNLTLFQKVDAPINRILIDGVLLTVNAWLRALTSEGAILGGRVEFVKSDNSNSSLMSGRVFFRAYICPPGAAEDITFDFQYDPNYLDALFA